MSKRKRNEGIDEIALQLNDNRKDFEVSIDSLKSELQELISIKRMLVEKIHNISKYINKTGRAFNLMDKKAQSLLIKLHKADNETINYQNAYIIEKQLRSQSDDQVAIMEDHVDYIETQLSNSQFEIDEMKNTYNELKDRFNFVEESNIHEMKEICNKYEKIKEMFTCDFLTSVGTVNSTIKTLNGIVIPEDDDNCEGVCIVCKSEKNNMICIPCGHQCMCEDCSRYIEERCPYCNTNISHINKVFVV